MAKGSKAVTIKDVAAAAGVSPSTVSVILNRKGSKYRISEHTQAKVLSLAEELNYKTNFYARNLAVGSAAENPIICVFWGASLDNGPLMDFYSGLERYRDECGRSFEFAIHPYKADTLSSMRKIIDLGLCQGLIVTGFSEADEDFLKSVDTLIPTVLFNRDLGNINAVYIDNYTVGQQAANCLLKNSPTSLICVNPLKKYKNPGIRFAGFYDACIKAGVSSDDVSVIYMENSYEGGYAAAEKLVGVKPPIGVFVSGDTMIAGFIKCLNNHNLAIPGDVFVVCFGNNIACEISTPSITSISPPSGEMGYDCMRMIDLSLQGRIGNGNVKKHDCKLIYRESCPELAD